MLDLGTPVLHINDYITDISESEQMWLESLVTFADDEKVPDQQFLHTLTEIHQPSASNGENNVGLKQNASGSCGKFFFLFFYFYIFESSKKIYYVNVLENLMSHLDDYITDISEADQIWLESLVNLTGEDKKINSPRKIQSSGSLNFQ